MIRATNKVFAVIGDPIHHSLSPVMQNWMIEYFNLPAVYTAFHVKNENLEKTVEAMRAMGISGLNVTVPHKEAVLPFVNEIADDTKMLQAANTLKNVNGVIKAFTTDSYGFIESLGKNRQRFEDSSVVMFGAGGAAKSIAYALAKLKVKSVTVLDIEQQRVDHLSKQCSAYGISQVTGLLSQQQDLTFLKDKDVIINTSPVGMYPNIQDCVIDDFSMISDRHFVYDLVYNPGKTKLLAEAEKQGAAIQNGLEMLIFQGLESLRIWMDNKDLILSKDALTELKQIMMAELLRDE